MPKFLVALALLLCFDARATDTLPPDLMRLFNEAYGLVRSNYVDIVDDRKLVASCVDGMVTALDRQSTYLDKPRNPEPAPGVGVGLELRVKDGLIMVASPITGGPAARAGIRAGDVVLRVGSTSTLGRPLSPIVELLFGDKGSTVKVVVAREGEARVREYELVRERISLRSADSRLLEGGVGYIHPGPFKESSIALLANALIDLDRQAERRLRGLVLDLRGNTGGLLYVSIGVTAAFLPNDLLIAQTRGRAKDATMSLHARRSDYIRYLSARNPLDDVRDDVRWSVPLAVLVDRETASGAEIVAGALQDHGRATIIGSTTFGLGTVSSLLPLSKDAGEGALRLTTARYFTPKGRSFDGIGLEPDIKVVRAEGASAEGDPELERALAHLAARSAAAK